MNLITSFEKAKQELYNHVGFEESIVVYAIEDRTTMFWKISKKENFITFAPTREEMSSAGNYYYNRIHPQRFYPKRIYRGKKLTMVIVATDTDDNKFFAFFDNSKEIIGEI